MWRRISKQLHCYWIRFRSSWISRKNLVHVRTGKQENRARRKEEKQEGKKCTTAESYLLPWLAGITPGAVPSSGLRKSTGERRHTCLIDASIYVVDDSSSSVMNENGKAMSRQKVVFGTRHDQPVAIPATASLFGWNTFVRFCRSKQQVRGDDQSPYQSWHSPLRWATSYAHEVAPCWALYSYDIVWLLDTELDTHTHTLQNTSSS